MQTLDKIPEKTRDDFRLTNHLPKIDNDKIISEIIEGLTADSPFLPSKYFYDDYGSLLFEKITTLEEYYPTSTEQSIMSDAFPKMLRPDSPIWQRVNGKRLD